MTDTDPSPGGRYQLQTDGVYFEGTHPKARPIWICARLEVISYSRDDRNEKWAKVVRFRDADGIEHVVPLPEALLVDNGTTCRRLLSSRGLKISPHRDARELLMSYISSVEPSERIRSVQRLGWFGDVFVFPDETIGQKTREIVKWQGQPETDHPFKCSGSLDDWRNSIGKYSSGNSRLVFGVSCAFAASLLSPLDEESGGFHFRGPSSLGKTTALRVAGSVCGGGGRNGYLQSWLTTANGLEAIAEGHNDFLLCLDELSQVSPEDAGKTPYLLANSQGKGRMTKYIAARQRPRWSTIFLSSGEVSLQDHLKGSGKAIRGGQHVRFVEIAADAEKEFGLFENIHAYPLAGSFARELSDATLKYYGTPLREFLKSIINDAGIELVKDHILAFRDDFMKAYCQEDASGEVSRVARRFALVAAAGEVASIIGITGWVEGEATTAAAVCFQSWLRCRGTSGGFDDEVGVKQVRAFIETHGASRFQRGKEVVPGRVGFIRRQAGKTEYCVLPEAFENEVCAGLDSTMVGKALDRRGYLRHGEERLQLKVRVPGGPAVWAYAIQASLLGE